jgi:hypothetical protein
MVTVLRDPRMWVAAVLATVIGSIGWTLVLGIMASSLDPPPPAAANDPGHIQIPVIRRGEEPEQPIPAVLLAGGIALLLFGAAGFVSFVVVNRLNDDDETTPA